MRYTLFLQSPCGYAFGDVQTSAFQSDSVAEAEAHYRVLGCDGLSSSNSVTHALKVALATLNLSWPTTNV